jgi:hypothetical protein
VTLILCDLTFSPALALGPLAEGIHYVAMDHGRVARLDRDMLQQGTCAVTAQGRAESASPTGWDRAVVR